MAYCTFLLKGTINSFQNLKRHVGLNNDDFSRFLQVRHYIDQIQKGCTQGCWDNILLKDFMDAYLGVSNQKTISKIYMGLQQTKCSSVYVKQKWEREGNLAEGEGLNKTSSSTLCCEFCWKKLNRFFITPADKRHYTNSSSCWWQCGCLEANNFLHILVFESFLARDSWGFVKFIITFFKWKGLLLLWDWKREFIWKDGKDG